MLYLIGSGIHDYKDISLRSIDALKRCKRVFFEGYTSPQKINIGCLGKLVGKDIKTLSRAEVESSEILFSKEDTALIVIGDPLVATTHQHLIDSAEERGIKTKILHSSSVVTAVCETGLHIYKFGKIASIPFPAEGFRPTTPCETIKQNLSINAHTLVLLDIGMEASEGITYLLTNCREIDRERKAFVCADLGGKNIIISGKLGELSETKIDAQPQVLIIPAEMHFTEEKSFEKYR